jgi:hypothetical protein
MSVTFPGGLPNSAPILTKSPATPFQAPSLGYTAAAFALPPTAQPLLQSTFQSSQARVHSSTPSLPQTSQQYKSLAKAVGFILPAIALAKFAPGQSERVAKEWLPSDWKVWAKMGLGIASMSQMNKAFNWTPPPWLGALMNVSLMAGLMTGLTRSSLKVIAILGPCMAALVQGTQYIGDKLEKPLHDNYNIPPWATRLGLSVISMGTGLMAFSPFFKWISPKMPSVFQEQESAATAAKANQAKNPAIISTGCGCCGGPICLNETANYGVTAFDAVKKQLNNRKQENR